MRFILLVLGGYILFKLIRSILIPGPDNQKIKSNRYHKKTQYNNLNISDADFEDINEDRK